MRIIEEIFNIIAPHQCAGCGKEGAVICSKCASGLPAVPPRCYMCGRWNDDSRTCAGCRKRATIHSLWTVTKYEGLAKDLLHGLKFERSGSSAVRMASLMADKCVVQDGMVVTFAPTSPSRVRQRGYDQAALLAKELAKKLRLPFAPCLARIGDQRQVGKTRDERKRQMESAFRPVNQHLFDKKHVLLVDDVLTTGATCEVATRVLRQAGAKRVSAAVFAVA